ncbi:MAG: hypothetical protein PHI68_06520, partial [Candidatus Cloacimonetes bacterium]|nr:hypothetical protein [Candidatus Cloacimonadota bacterium]
MEKYPNINILLNLEQRYIPKAEFVFRTFCYILRLNPRFSYGSYYEGTHLYYGNATTRTFPIRIHHDPHTAEFFEQQELYPLEQVTFCKYKDEYIPFLFSPGGDIFSFAESNCVIRKDIIAGGFYFLTCWNEYILSLRGIPKGRVDYKQSLQYRWSFTELPVVDVYSQLLLYAMSKYTPEFIRDITWGNNKSFAVSLSHDIDYWNAWTGKHILQTIKYNAKSFLARPFHALYKLSGHLFHKFMFHSAFKQIRRIAGRETDLGVASTWFLLAYSGFDDERQNYIADIVAREQIIDLLGEREVGLHGSPDSAFNPELLASELENIRGLGFKPIGFRTHYLNFDISVVFPS